MSALVVLALRLTTWPLAAQCLAVLISRSRSTYVRRRELFCLRLPGRRRT